MVRNVPNVFWLFYRRNPKIIARRLIFKVIFKIPKVFWFYSNKSNSSTTFHFQPINILIQRMVRMVTKFQDILHHVTTYFSVQILERNILFLSTRATITSKAAFCTQLEFESYNHKIILAGVNELKCAFYESKHSFVPWVMLPKKQFLWEFS